MGSIVYIVIIVLFFLWMRNSGKKNQKKEKAMQDSLRPGMYVMLRDGLYGTIVDVGADTLVINFSVDGADEGCLTVEKASVGSIVDAGTASQAPRDTMALEDSESGSGEEQDEDAVTDVSSDQPAADEASDSAFADDPASIGDNHAPGGDKDDSVSSAEDSAKEE